MPTGPRLLPDDSDLEPLHLRRYETRSYLIGHEHLLVRGAIVDNKPPGLYIEQDPDWLEMHRMEVELKVRLRDLEIVDARVGFETHPYGTCPTITESYEKLIGLNVARGFNRQLRELFGGPRGCTHTTALLQAMAPAVHQSIWSVSIKLRRLGVWDELPPEESDAQRERALQANLNTCHVWDEDGTRVELIRAGNDDDHLPDPIRNRLEALGVDANWSESRRP